MRDRHGMLLVQTDHELRPPVAEMIDEAVVQAAKARAGRERDIGNVECGQRVGHRIAAEARFAAKGPHRPLRRHRIV